MIEIYHKNIKEKVFKILDVQSFKTGSWIYAENIDDDDIELLSEKFSLDAGLLKDAMDPYEVPRSETKGGILYIFTRVPHLEDGQILTTPLLIAIGNNFLATASRIHLPFLEKLVKTEHFFTTQKTNLFLQVFSQITSAYNEFLTSINKQVRGISVKLNKVTNADIVQFVGYEEILNDFMSALVPTNTILSHILSGKSLELFPQDKELIEDLSLSNGQLIEICRANLKNIVNIRQAYSTIMANDLNRVIKLLTSLTIILTIPMIISSLYGMNLKLPFDQSPLAFIGIIATIVLISGILIVIFVKNRWL